MTGPDDGSRDDRDLPRGKGGKKKTMKDKAGSDGGGTQPIDLDGRRSQTGRKEAEIRRDLLADIRSGQAAARRRQEAFEDALFARPAATWGEAAAKVEYLLQLFAATPHAVAPERQRIIAGVLDDLVRLKREDEARAATEAGEADDDPDGRA